MNVNRISISKGNQKMGAVSSFSLPAITTCRPDAPCFKDCYAVKMERLYKNVKNAYWNNFRLLQEDPDSVFLQLKAHIMTVRFFRFHVSGDFYSYEYFVRVMDLARECNWCKFLAFTKRYEFANRYCDEGNEIPENFSLIFSAWGPDWTFPNPYNFPVSQVVFKGDEPDPEWFICGGNCQECGCKGVGCWQLKKGQTIAFDKH